MSRHRNSNKHHPVIEIISVKNIELIPWEKKENFLVIKRLGGKLILIGLREYLKKLRKTRMVKH